MISNRRMQAEGPRRLADAARLLLCLVTGVSALATVASEARAQTITGTLMEVETSQPISLGLVIMMTEDGDSITSTVTNGQGQFTVESEEAGSFVLLASAFGFKETAAGVFELGQDASMDVQFRIAAAPMPIEGILVSLQRPVLEHNLVRNGFVRRVTRGLGRFITPAQIERSSARTAADLLRGVPGVHITRPGGAINAFQGEMVRMVSQNDYCAPTIFLDGARIAPNMTSDTPLDALAPLQTIDAIEVYRRPSEVPIEYGMTSSGNNTGRGPCGVLVIWTKTR
ncbi:MAG: TonB-dependent receptor plug domain-containing protein [Gemmatimonadetes bacterium]|nr:TonB-dependent receptor plug domain-containing protein [Gemmatimonadota bacterium]